VFPPGYPVAKVTHVKRAGATFASVDAKPTAMLDRDREVLLAWFKPVVTPADMAPAPAVPAAAPNAVPTTAPGARPGSTPAPPPVTPGAGE
jgi:cell shape-determining protein MreC